MKPWAIIRVSAEDTNVYEGLAPLNGTQAQPVAEEMEAFEAQRQKSMEQLNQFWKDIGLVLSQPAESSELHNIPILEFTYSFAHFLPFSDILASVTSSPDERLQAAMPFTEDFCTVMYDLVDWRRQYHTWLEHCRIVKIPQVTPPQSLDDFGQSVANTQPPPTATLQVESSASTTVDMRYYNTVLDSVPDELCTVPLVLHCMLEQVSATNEGRSPPDPNPARSDGLPQNVADLFDEIISKSSLSHADMQMLRNELQLTPKYEDGLNAKLKAPELYAFMDERALRQKSAVPVDAATNKKYGTNFSSVKPLVDVAEAEKTILKYSPLALAIANMPDPSQCSIRRRAALQNMISNLASSTGLTKLELGYALKLLMFEALTLPSVDEEGFLSPNPAETVLPWDDPYPFFRGMVTEEELAMLKEEWKEKMIRQLESEREEEARRSASVRDNASSEPKTPPPEVKSPERKSRKSTKPSSPKSKTPSPPGTGKRAGGSGKKRKGSKSPATPPEEIRADSEADNRRGILNRSASGARRSANFVHFEHDPTGNPVHNRQRFDDFEVRMVDRPIDESIADIRRALQRKLTEYCFAEFLSPDALMQSLQDCYYERPHLSAYKCKQDNSLLLAFSNPRNHKMFYCDNWESRSFTNVGFRKYLRYVAQDISDWLVKQESTYMAKLLAEDLDEETTQEEAKAKNDKKDKGKKGRAASPKKGKNAEVKENPEDKTYSPFITEDFQHKASLKFQKTEEEELKKAEEAKLAGKGKRGGSKSPTRRAPTKTPDKNIVRTTTGEKVPSRRSESVHSVDLEREPYPFTSYDLANQLMVASGLTVTLLPSDGGIIRAERFRFETGRESVRVSSIVESNVFSVHVGSPVMEMDPENPVCSHFGSITANLTNGMVLSMSAFGDGGICPEGAPYTPKPGQIGTVGPPEAATPQPNSNASPAGKKAARNKSPQKSRSRSPKSREEKEPPKEAAKEELVPSSEEGARQTVEENKKEPPTYTKSPLTATYPNGLSMKFLYSKDDADRTLITVRQSYEVRRHPISHPGAETSRLVTPEGCTIRFLPTGETQILYPDGSMYLTTPIEVKPTPEEIAAQEAAQEAAEQRMKSKEGKKHPLQAKLSKSLKDPETAPEGQPKPVYQIITFISSDGYLSKFNTMENKFVEQNRKLSSINRTDPATGQKWISREDGVETVMVPPGAAGNPEGVATRCVLFPDQTCVTSRIETIISELTNDEEDVLTWVRVEAPAFATITADRLRWETHVEFGNDFSTGTCQSQIVCLPDESFQVFPSTGGRLVVDKTAKLMFWPKASQYSETGQEYVYMMSHSTPTVMQVVDPSGNSFSVSHDGRAAVVSRQQMEQQEEQQNGEVVKTPSSSMSKRLKEQMGDELHSPRYFVISPNEENVTDGGWELKRYNGDVQNAIVTAERDSRCHVTRKHIEDEPRVTSVTVLNPFAQLPIEKWNGLRCDVKDLAPPALHPAGWYVPQSKTVDRNGLSARNVLLGNSGSLQRNMPRILVRRMFQMTPFSEPLKEVVIEALRNFVEQTVETNNTRRNMAPFDPRSAQEIRDSEVLLAKFSQIGTPRSQEEAEARLVAELDALGSPKLGSSSNAFPSIKQEQRRVEVLQKEEDLKFYRKGCKMNYFKSDDAHRFLKSQAPKLDDLFDAKEDELRRYSEYDEQLLALQEQASPEVGPGQEKFVSPDEQNSEHRPRAATPSQRRKVGADVTVVETPFLSHKSPIFPDREKTLYNINKTPVLLPNVLLAIPGSGVDFGEIVEGSQVSRQFVLKNAGQRPIRFSVREPAPETGVVLRYEHGQIAPGMKRQMTVSLLRNAHSLSCESVEISVRYDGGSLVVPVNFKEVKVRSSQAGKRSKNPLLMSVGSEGDELVTEMFSQSPSEAQQFQPKPPNYPNPNKNRLAQRSAEV